MADQRSVLKEFRFLDEKRRTQGLSREEQARLDGLRELVGEAAPAAPRAGFDVNAAAARLRDSLLPAGLRNRPPPTPEVVEELVPEEPALDAWAAPSADAAPLPEPEPAAEPAWAEAPLDPLFDPASLADDGAAAAGAEAAWDPNAAAAWDPNDPNAAAYDPNAPAYDPNAAAWDPNAPAYDPNAAAWDPNAPAYDPNAAAWDPNAPAYDPNAAAWDPNAQAYDPGAGPFDPNAPALDGSAQTWDPNAAWDPNAQAYDPDAAPYDPNAPALDAGAQPWDPNAAGWNPNAQADDLAAAPFDPNAPALDANAQAWDPNAAAWDPNAPPDDATAQGNANAQAWDPAAWAAEAEGAATPEADPSALPEPAEAPAGFGDPAADAGFDPSAEGALPPLDLAFAPASDGAPELGAYDELAPANAPLPDADAFEALLPFDAAAASAIGPEDLPEGFDGPPGDFLAQPRARGPYDDTAGFDAAAWPDPPPAAPEPNAFEAAPQLTPEASADWHPDAALDGGFALASHGSFESEGAPPEPAAIAFDDAPAPAPESAQELDVPAAGAAPDVELPALEFDVDAETAEIPTLDGNDLLEELPEEEPAAIEPTLAIALPDPEPEPVAEPVPEPEAPPEPEALPEPAPAASAAPFVPGVQRVVVHTVEGHVKRGVLEDVDLGAASFALQAAPGAPPEAVDAEQVKAIFFMLAAGERAPAPEGSRVRVTFRDGRQVAGFSPDYAEGAPGFFMIPADTRTSTGRIWVRAAAVKTVTVG